MIVMLTALQVEYEAVLRHLVDVREHRHQAGTVFDVGRLAAHPERRVALATIGMGNLTAAAIAERAIAEFRPAAMLFVGVAGGLRDWLALGDVVVATKVAAYHGGRSEDDEFHARPRTWDISHRIEQVARRLPSKDAWRQQFTESAPAVHFEPIAAGEVVLNSRTSPLREQLRRNYNDVVAIEMESAGVALAGHLNDGVPTATVRGISDLAGGAKDVTDSAGWQSVAAGNAAAFAVLLAAAIDDNNSITDKLEPRVQNVARDNAKVDQQIGVNYGETHFGGTR